MHVIELLTQPPLPFSAPPAVLLNGLQGLSLVEGQPTVPSAALGHSPQLATSPFSPAMLGQQQQPPQQQELGSIPLIAVAAGPALAQQGPAFIPPPSGPSHSQLGVAMRGQPQLRGRKTQQQQQQQDYEKIRRTVYVCDIDQQVSEWRAAAGSWVQAGVEQGWGFCMVAAAGRPYGVAPKRCYLGPPPYYSGFNILRATYVDPHACTTASSCLQSAAPPGTSLAPSSTYLMTNSGTRPCCFCCAGQRD